MRTRTNLRPPQHCWESSTQEIFLNLFYSIQERQLTYFLASQCLHTCSCSCWEPESLTQVHWDGACVGLHTWQVVNRESSCGPKPPLSPNCGSPGKQLCTHPCKGSIHHVLLLMPFLKDCTVSLAAPGLEQHCSLHTKQLQAQAGTTFPSTRWGLENNVSLEISLVAIFGGRIDFEVLHMS